MKNKKCKICGVEFIPQTTIASVCGYKCAVELTNKRIDARVAKEKKNATKELIDAKEAIKSRSDWIKEAQQAVNAYVRARDKGKPCISCGKPTKNGDHAGHWKPTSTSPELRFNEQNIHLQCVQCNLHFHGNVAKYRLGLIERLGIDIVEWLEGPHEPKKYTVDDLKEIKRFYKELLKNDTNNI